MKPKRIIKRLKTRIRNRIRAPLLRQKRIEAIQKIIRDLETEIGELRQKRDNADFQLRLRFQKPGQHEQSKSAWNQRNQLVSQIIAKLNDLEFWEAERLALLKKQQKQK